MEAARIDETILTAAVGILRRRALAVLEPLEGQARAIEAGSDAAADLLWAGYQQLQAALSCHAAAEAVGKALRDCAAAEVDPFTSDG